MTYELSNLVFCDICLLQFVSEGVSEGVEGELFIINTDGSLELTETL